jgi:hypothetical protein
LLTRFIWGLAALAALRPEAAGAPERPMLGEPAPSFRLPDLSGELLGLEDLRGRFIVLHFGTSW